MSPSEGQVAHALLTRPPLTSASPSPEGNFFARLVRLACVKHAASVHPEPGSNSQKFGIYNPAVAGIQIFHHRPSVNDPLILEFLSSFTQSFFTRVTGLQLSLPPETFVGSLPVRFVLHCLIYKVHLAARDKGYYDNTFQRPCQHLFSASRSPF